MIGRTAGFTLIEVLAVLCLIAILASLTLPSFLDGRSGIEARLCRDRIVADIRAARAAAVARARHAGISWGETGYTLDLGFREPIERELPAGITVAFTGRDDEDRLDFDANGVTDGGLLTMQAADRTYRLRVEEDGDCVWE